jgi:hypothetical protein
VLARGARSPVELPIPDDPDDSERLWARAPGYGFGSLVVPRATGGEFRLPLAREGALIVRVAGVPSEPALALRVRCSADLDEWDGVLFERRLDWERGSVEQELAGIAAGSYVLAVELGHRHRYARALALQHVDVLPGSRTEVLLDVSGFEGPPRATIAGTLTVPPAWELDSFGIRFELLGEPTADGEAYHYLAESQLQPLDPAAGRFAFRFEGAQPGRWELWFNPLGTTLSADVPPAGLDGVELTVPEPAFVTVRVHDAQGGAPVEDARVSWMPARDGFESGGVLNGAGARGAGVFAFTAPAGPTEVWLFSERFAFRRARLDALPGENELRIETELACGLVLRVRDGETSLPLDAFAPAVASVAGGAEGSWKGSDPADLQRTFAVPEPGLYRILLTAPPGYRNPPAAEVKIPARTFVERVIQVERE